MPPDRLAGRAYDPPILTYEEAISVATPRADRVLFEQRSLLNPSAASSSAHGSSSRRYPGGYRAPTVESDEDTSDDELDYLDAEDGRMGDDEDETNLVRREMQELEMEDEADRPRSLWGKRINFSLPTWKWRWRWRLPRFQIRLPSAPDRPESSSSETAPPDTSMRTMLRPGTHLFFLIARLLALFLILGFLYLLFSGSLVGSLAGHMGGIQPSPETLRNYILDSVDPRRLRASVQHFTAYAHLAGSEGGYAIAKDVETMFHRAGLHGIGIDEYFVYLNYPAEGGRGVQLLGKDLQATWEAKMEEEDLGQETAGRLTMAFHAHSKHGIAEGPLIYANYGSRDDFRILKDMGINMKGAVALVRYGGTPANLGLKVKAAEEAGFAGCMIYSDPEDDGFIRGAVAPEGSYMPADGVHRGSVALTNWMMGDVLTPGWESKKGLPRMEPNKTRGLVGIPSIPLAWRDAEFLLQQLAGVGKKAPQEWAGGVPDVKEWWTGDTNGPKVRMRNLQDEATQKTIWNVYGRIEGYEQGEKSVILGNARDTLAFGATDPHSGTAVLIELARLFGGLAEQGWRPLRTIEFMSWDGEAYNHIGSTEYVERKAKELRQDAVAYINVAAAVSGTEFHASGSPIFQDVLARVLRHVGDPAMNNNLQVLWEQRSGRIESPAVGDGAHVPFLTIGGTSSLDVRFEGGSWPKGSGYDDFDLVNEVGDPGWVYHTLMGKVVGLLLIELADRHVLPFQISAYADALEAWTGRLTEWVKDQLPKLKESRMDGTQMDKSAHHQDTIRRGLAGIARTVKMIKDKSSTFDDWAAGWQRTMLSSGWFEDQPIRADRLQYNDVLARFESSLLDVSIEGGYPNRTQFKHVVYGPRTWSLSAEDHFPGIRDAIEDKDWLLAEKLVARTLDTVQAAARELGEFQSQGFT